MATRLNLYSRPGCHLCEEARAILRHLARELPIEWREVDIESDPSLFQRFRYEIPVVEVIGGEVLRWPTTRERVRRAILAAGARR